MNTTTGGQIPGYEATNNADDKVSHASTDDVSATTKPKEGGESPADVRPAEMTAKARKMLAQCTRLRSSFTRSPEQIWKDPPGFYGNENYGFECTNWVNEQEKERRITDSKQ